MGLLQEAAQAVQAASLYIEQLGLDPITVGLCIEHKDIVLRCVGRFLELVGVRPNAPLERARALFSIAADSILWYSLSVQTMVPPRLGVPPLMRTVSKLSANLMRSEFTNRGPIRPPAPPRRSLRLAPDQERVAVQRPFDPREDCLVCSEALGRATNSIQCASGCGHWYHAHCIGTWAHQNGGRGVVCPTCQGRVLSMA